MAEKTSEFKIVIVGGSGVGKSSVINSFCGNIVEEDLEADDQVQVVADQQVVIKRMEVQGKDICLKIVDTAGSVLENQKSTKALYKGAQHREGAPVVFVIGNKCDLEDRRVISIETLEGFATDHGVYFLEVSGNTGVKVKKAFDLMTEEILLAENQDQAAAHANHCNFL
ncbi:ras-related protein RABA5b-like isoform X2 [Pocillopora damicornis]|uniref:ras-related protein RABA5b-like isoform X2 n=1 Tax=Pocillopora damicornis TaxID=46731 RepID=UPI000F54E99D|nr:ras-related protein RABA5b-like isoform X2 [Pocillopora damicornis]